MDVVSISSKRMMEDFIRLPYLIYQDCQQYVPDLKRDIRDLFDQRKNPASPSRALARAGMKLLTPDACKIFYFLAVCPAKGGGFWTKGGGFWP